jgi:hypothetical protein
MWRHPVSLLLLTYVAWGARRQYRHRRGFL